MLKGVEQCREQKKEFGKGILCVKTLDTVQMKEKVGHNVGSWKAKEAERYGA